MKRAHLPQAGDALRAPGSVLPRAVALSTVGELQPDVLPQPSHTQQEPLGRIFVPQVKQSGASTVAASTDLSALAFPTMGSTDITDCASEISIGADEERWDDLSGPQPVIHSAKLSPAFTGFHE